MFHLQAGPRPPFPSDSQDWPGFESEMNPKPDFGYTSYNGTGKLQGKVAIITGQSVFSQWSIESTYEYRI